MTVKSHTSRRSFFVTAAALLSTASLAAAGVSETVSAEQLKLARSVPLAAGIKIRGLYTDGRVCNIEVWDLADKVLALDSNDKPYEALTTRVDVDGVAFYEQVPKWIAEAFGDPALYRFIKYQTYLERLNINTSSLHFLT